MNGAQQFLGIVQNGRFVQLWPALGPGGPRRFTRIQPQEARPPESDELDLAAYEGSAIMIRGQDHGGWVYTAEVVDQAGPILTVLVREVFGSKR